MTILDGNHRLMAAALPSPEPLQKLRFSVRLSSRIKDVIAGIRPVKATLFRYRNNLLTQV